MYLLSPHKGKGSTEERDGQAIRKCVLEGHWDHSGGQARATAATAATAAPTFPWMSM